MVGQSVLIVTAASCEYRLLCFKYHKLCGSDSGTLLLPVLESGKSEIKVPAWLGSGEGPLPALHTAFFLCPHVVEAERSKLRTPIPS